MVGKGENAGVQHVLLFPLCFHKASFIGSLKVGIVWYRDKYETIKTYRNAIFGDMEKKQVSGSSNLSKNKIFSNAAVTRGARSSIFEVTGLNSSNLRILSETKIFVAKDLRNAIWQVLFPP